MCPLRDWEMVDGQSLQGNSRNYVQIDQELEISIRWYNNESEVQVNYRFIEIESE